MMFVILGIDGLSSNLLQQELANVPHIASLLALSAYSYMARADVPAISSINWGTHFFGHGAAYHCWVNNEKAFACSGAQSIFDVIPNSTGYGAWDSLHRHIPAFHTTSSDSVTADRIALHVKNRDRNLVAGIFNAVDDANHMSKSQAHALQHVDACVGNIMEHITPSDYVLLVSDHGPRDCKWWQWTCHDHYGMHKSEIETPMLLKGPGVAPGPITRRVTHQDTSYYVLNALNYSIPCDWKLGEHTSCVTSWPGKTSHVATAEENLRVAVDTAIWVAVPVFVFLLIIASLPWCCRNEQHPWCCRNEQHTFWPLN